MTLFKIRRRNRNVRIVLVISRAARSTKTNRRWTIYLFYGCRTKTKIHREQHGRGMTCWYRWRTQYSTSIQPIANDVQHSRSPFDRQTLTLSSVIEYAIVIAFLRRLASRALQCNDRRFFFCYKLLFTSSHLPPGGHAKPTNQSQCIAWPQAESLAIQTKKGWWNSTDGQMNPLRNKSATVECRLSMRSAHSHCTLRWNLKSFHPFDLIIIGVTHRMPPFPCS